MLAGVAVGRRPRAHRDAPRRVGRPERERRARPKGVDGFARQLARHHPPVGGRRLGPSAWRLHPPLLRVELARARRVRDDAFYMREQRAGSRRSSSSSAPRARSGPPRRSSSARPAPRRHVVAAALHVMSAMRARGRSGHAPSAACTSTTTAPPAPSPRLADRARALLIRILPDCAHAR